ncbi:hypothetical protein HFO91_31685 [Rhizobium leguminosarum]|uniref:hypothetical protein n=1 Tax=Rhizobium leguminosarum TaxID=384 RepID=UPI001C959810|nr:hypothetical protein [Rhizobium leguminosarum]MBY5454138.1 hypothetical protein [Rhizobium leguminosarum]
MIDRRAELGLWVGRLETILIGLGVLRQDGDLAISPAVLTAAHLMTREVLLALQDSELAGTSDSRA